MKFIQNLFNYLKGYCEIVFSHNQEFKYAIKGIDLKNANGRYSTLIYYQMIGSRHIQHGNATQLNDSTLFTKFKPQEAQLIVSIATLETMMNIPYEDVVARYIDYVTTCANKLQLKR